jgi:serine/threonine protein kinase
MLEADAIITLAHGRYRLRARIAGSAYGVLWRASPNLGGADVALKLINREQMLRAAPPQQARWTSSMHNEIAFLRQLAPWDGRHIVRLLDSGEQDGLPVMALELLDGDLGQHVATERAAGRHIGLVRALGWIAQINQALAKVHQYGWRYLDLKPSNLLIDAARGNLKLADFGTNRSLADRAAHTYTGTANWQAPEQFFPVAGGYLTDARSDYFPLGALLFYLVTGGQALRFCRDCGDAYREHLDGAAAAMRARHPVELPPVLADDEAALFLRCAARDTRADMNGDTVADAGTGALALLRALLGSQPEARPAHAIDISRLLAQASRDAGHAARDAGGRVVLTATERVAPRGAGRGLEPQMRRAA